MDRREEITKYITKQSRGIEVGPWHSPIVPKREGFNCLSLDVFDVETLHMRAANDPDISRDVISRIETVDIVGPAATIQELVETRGELGTFNYVISSHNFEHLPNPIKFLQGCGRALVPGGFLSISVPDNRTCYDFFRPHSVLAGWIEAFFEIATVQSYPRYSSKTVYIRCIVWASK